jgi:hypothetical protein
LAKVGGRPVSEPHGPEIWLLDWSAAARAFLSHDLRKETVMIGAIRWIRRSVLLVVAILAMPRAAHAQYAQCAVEGQVCNFVGRQDVIFGTGNSFVGYQKVAGGFVCNTSNFGADPAPGVAKACYAAAISGPAGYTACAKENEICQYGGGVDVIYGAGGQYSLLSKDYIARNNLYVNGGIACNTATFGDPHQGVPKQCYFDAGGVAGGHSSPFGYQVCATEGGTCTFGNSSGGVVYLLFGSIDNVRGGRFWVQTIGYSAPGGSVGCNTSNFGDPDPGVVKFCAISFRSGPAGSNSCARGEGGTCSPSFSGGFYYYGTAPEGRFFFKSLATSGGFVCSATVFGGDPSFGNIKYCWN